MNIPVQIVLLLASKLTIPPLRSNMIDRAELLRRFQHEGEQKKLVLVSAPAGYGKTSLVCQWLENIQALKAWYTIDEDDSDPEVFFRHLLAALSRVDVSLGDVFDPYIQGKNTLSGKEVAVLIINTLSTRDSEMVLVLDDCHEIRSAEVFDALSLLLKHMPEQLHLVLVTRRDLPVSLSRLRAENSIVEIRSADLAFSQTESELFFKEMIGFKLSREQIQHIEASTEGWCAALQMAALTLQNQEDTGRWEADLPVANPFIFEYLLEEVLQKQPEEIQTFLHRTAFIRLLNAESTSGITGLEDTGRVLSEIEKGNLFLQPVDQEHRWFRYHPLFAEMLRRRVEATEPLSIKKVHRQSAVWFAANGYYDEAFHHVTATGDMEFTADLLEEHLHYLVSGHQVNSSLRLISSLPESLRRRRILLELYRILILFAMDSIIDLDAAVNALEEDFNSRIEHCSKEKQQLIQVMIQLARGASLLQLGQYESCLDIVGDFLGRHQGLPFGIKETFQFLVAVSLFWKGDVSPCSDYIESALASIKSQKKAYLITIELMTMQVRAERNKGNLIQCQEILRRIRSLLQDQRIRVYQNIYAHLFAEASIAYQQNRFAEALELLKTCIFKAEANSRSGLLAKCFSLKALIYQTIGDSRQSNRFNKKARFHVQRSASVYRNKELDLVAVEIALMRRNMPTVIKWFNERKLDNSEPFSHFFEKECLIAARYNLISGRFEQSLKVLNALRSRSLKRDRLESVMKIDIVLAAGNQALGRSETANVHLEDAIAHALPQGYIRPFLDLATYLRDVLLVLVKSEVIERRDFIRELIKLIEKENDTTRLLPKAAVNTFDILTSREVQILQLISAGLSNREIAEMNYIELSTVKSHIKSIYRKMDVNSRHEAVVEARDKGIV